MKHILLFITLSLLPVSMLHAQEYVSWTISVGNVFPVGDFAKSTYIRASNYSNCNLISSGKYGGAAPGISIGCDVQMHLGPDNLCEIFAAEFLLNPVRYNVRAAIHGQSDLSARSIINSLYLDETAITSSSKHVNRYPNYINIPILLGMRYTFPLPKSLGLYTEACLGLNVRFATRTKYSGTITFKNPLPEDPSNQESLLYSETLRYAADASFACRAAVGLNITSHLSVSLLFYYLGKGTLAVKDDATVNTSFSEPGQVHQTVDLAPQQPILLAAKFSYTF